MEGTANREHDGKESLEKHSGNVSSVNRSEISEGRVGLKRQIGLAGCVAFVIGSVIGSGIFISPKGVLQNTGSVGLSLLVWVACGILSAIGALCYAELGTTIPESGSDFTYIFKSFGPVPAFLRIYTIVVADRTGTCAVLVITAATYLAGPFFGECGPPMIVIQLLAASLLAAVFCLNSVSVPWSNRAQIIFSIAKVLGLIIIIIIGLILIFQGKTGNLQDGFTPAINVPPEKIPLAFYSGLYAYAGWEALPSFTEEIVNIKRNVPLGVIISLTTITGIYITANLAYFVVLTPEELLASNAVALTFGDRVLGSWSVLMSIAVALSCIGAVNGTLFGAARMLMVSSREGVTPRVLGMIHVHYNTPLPAAVAFFPISVCMLMAPDVGTLLNYLSFTRWLFISIAVAVIPYYRWKYPDMPRPFKVPIILPIIFIISAMFVVIVSIYSSPVDCGIGAGIALTGIPIYLVFVWWKNKPQWFTNAMDSLTCFLQRFLFIAPEDKKME